MSLFSYMTTTQIKFKLAELEEIVRDQENLIKEMRAVLQYRADKEREKEKSDWFFLQMFQSNRFRNSPLVQGEAGLSSYIDGVVVDKETNQAIFESATKKEIAYRFLKEGVSIYYSASKGTIRFYLKKTQ